MTAHAMVEERRRCEALGMNGHLSKPIEPDDFYSTLARYYSAPAGVAAEIRPATPAVSPAVDIPLPEIAGLDAAAGLRRAGSNRKLYRQMLSMFVTDFADCSKTFAEHIAGARWSDAERLAHTLKGLAATIGVDAVSLPAAALEVACKGRQVDAADIALSALTLQIDPLLAALQQYLLDEPDTSAESTQLDGNENSRTEALTECLPQLRQLLQEGDSDAIELWEKHHKAFVGILPPQIVQRIGTALQNFEFDSAYALLAALPMESSTPAPRNKDQ
jgi:HPt (histidine-containing phosphotransfer) domain-containing protein